MTTRNYSVDGDNVSGDHSIVPGQDSVLVSGKTADVLVVVDGKGFDCTSKFFGANTFQLGVAMLVVDTAPVGTYYISAQNAGSQTGTNGQLNVGSRVLPD